MDHLTDQVSIISRQNSSERGTPPLCRIVQHLPRVATMMKQKTLPLVWFFLLGAIAAPTIVHGLLSPISLRSGVACHRGISSRTEQQKCSIAKDNENAALPKVQSQKSHSRDFGLRSSVASSLEPFERDSRQLGRIQSSIVRVRLCWFISNNKSFAQSTDPFSLLLANIGYDGDVHPLNVCCPASNTMSRLFTSSSKNYQSCSKGKNEPQSWAILQSVVSVLWFFVWKFIRFKYVSQFRNSLQTWWRLMRIFPFSTKRVVVDEDDENRVNPQPSIWVCNHISMLDLFYVLALDKKMRGKNRRPIKILYVSVTENMILRPVLCCLFLNYKNVIYFSVISGRALNQTPLQVYCAKCVDSSLWTWQTMEMGMRWVHSFFAD